MNEEQKMTETGYNDKKEEVYYSVGSFLLEIVKVFFLALIIITPIRMFLFQPFFVQGASMEPNFRNGEYLIINEFGYKKTDVGLGNARIFTVSPFKKLERENVVVFRYPKDPRQFFIKRVIGLPGEMVELKDGNVYISNKNNSERVLVDENNYLEKEIITDNSGGSEKVEIGEDEYFLMGDNRSHSYDSRSFGSVKESAIIGKVLIRAWPFSKINLF